MAFLSEIYVYIDVFFIRSIPVNNPAASEYYGALF